MQMLTDNPIHRTNEDRFGFAPYAHILAHVIRDTERLPFCIGIFGPWGTGKSSLMRMIDEIISSYDNTKSVWFNPWKYDQKEDLWHALIQTILYKIAEDAPKDVVQQAKNLATHTAWMILKKGVSNLTAGLISERDLNKLRKVITSQDELFHRHINNFEEDFTKVISLYTNGGKLVVFIDDLDRCIPENAITVLEALKLFVGDSECVFVLGMDHFIVEEGIKRRYGRHVKMSGRDYIDKIVQVPFYLPPVPFDKLREALSVAKTTNYTKTVWRVVELGLGGNPRKTKRFVNCFYLLNEVLRKSSDVRVSIVPAQDTSAPSPLGFDEQQFYLAKLLILQMSFANLYSFLTCHPEAWEDYENKLIKASNLNSQNRFLERNPNYKELWDDEELRFFMESTYHAPRSQFPAPPDRDVVDSLMQMINLVEDKQTRPKVRKEGVVPIRPKSVTKKALKKKAVKKKAVKKKAKKKK